MLLKVGRGLFCPRKTFGRQDRRKGNVFLKKTTGQKPWSVFLVKLNTQVTATVKEQHVLVMIISSTATGETASHLGCLRKDVLAVLRTKK
jgi:hypothetical protein